MSPSCPVPRPAYSTSADSGANGEVGTYRGRMIYAVMAVVGTDGWVGQCRVACIMWGWGMQGGLMNGCLGNGKDGLTKGTVRVFRI